MSLIIHGTEQNDDAWYQARLGIVSSSEFSTVLAQGRGPKDKKPPSVTRMKYLRVLAAERITGKRIDRYYGPDMQRGHEVEPEAREFYCMWADTDVQPVGFIYNDELRAGCSPDSLVGADGLVEIKSKQGDVQIEILEGDRVPPEHIAQLQGQLWVTGRKWVDLVCYCAGLKPLCKRVFPDLEYHARLDREVAKFNDELEMLVNRIAA